MNSLLKSLHDCLAHSMYWGLVCAYCALKMDRFRVIMRLVVGVHRRSVRVKCHPKWSLVSSDYLFRHYTSSIAMVPHQLFLQRKKTSGFDFGV